MQIYTTTITSKQDSSLSVTVKGGYHPRTGDGVITDYELSASVPNPKYPKMTDKMVFKNIYNSIEGDVVAAEGYIDDTQVFSIYAGELIGSGDNSFYYYSTEDSLNGISDCSAKMSQE